MAFKGCKPAGLFIPIAAVGPGPLQDLQVACISCRRTRIFTPLAAIGPEPPQSLQVASSGCSRANCALALPAWAPLLKGPRRELHASDEVANFQPA